MIPEGEPARADELWKTTCFEAFLRAARKKAYREWNFSPSGAWAAYDFKAYRKGRSDAQVAAPYVRFEDNLIWWALGATIAVPAGTEWALGLSAVLEEKHGGKSYWALAHGGDKPDFHARRLLRRAASLDRAMTLFGIDRLVADAELRKPA